MAERLQGEGSRERAEERRESLDFPRRTGARPRPRHEDERAAARDPRDRSRSPERALRSMPRVRGTVLRWTVESAGLQGWAHRHNIKSWATTSRTQVGRRVFCAAVAV